MMAPFILSVFGVLCVGSVINPRWALSLLLIMYPLEQALQGSVYYFRNNVAMANYIIGVVVLLSVVMNGMRGHINARGYLNPVWIVLVIGYGYSCFSILWSPSQTNAIALVTSGAPYLVMYILLAPLLVQDLKDWREVVVVSLVFGLCTSIAILGAPDFTMRSGRLGFDFTAKIRSSPLAIGELGGLLMLSSALFVVPERRYIFQIVRLAAFLCGVVLSVYSGSRGQFYFAAFLTIVLFPLSRPVRDLKQFFLLAVSAVGLLLVLAVLLSFLIGDQDVAARWLSGDKAEAAVGVRAANAGELLSAFMRTPRAWFTGLGLNAFTSYTGSLEPYSHAMFLDVLAEMGLVAFAILLWWLWLVIQGGRELLRRGAHSVEDRSSSTVLVAICAYQVLLMNKQGELWSSEHTVVYFLLLAKIIHCNPPVAEDEVLDQDSASEVLTESNP